MALFYFCNTCNEVIAGAGAIVKHQTKNHSLKDLVSNEDLRKYGIMRDPSAPTSSTNTADEITIAGVIKRVAYIGKSGKEITTRREGSHIAIRYEHLDDITGVSTKLTEQEYYKLLFAGGIPSTDVLHTFNNKQRGADDIASAILNTKTRIACVTTDPQDESNLLFSQYYWYGVHGDELAHPYRQFTGNGFARFRSNVDRDKVEFFNFLDGREVVIYYDLLTPRDDGSKPPYLTRVLITVLHEACCEEALNGKNTKQLILYELNASESSAVYSSTSLDWASAIVQDARSILCSPS